MYDKQDPGSKWLLLVGILLVVLVVGSDIAVNALYLKETDNEYLQKVGLSPNEEWELLRQKSRDFLHSSGANGESRHIPIEDAFHVVMLEYNK